MKSLINTKSLVFKTAWKVKSIMHQRWLMGGALLSFSNCLKLAWVLVKNWSGENGEVVSGTIAIPEYNLVGSSNGVRQIGFSRYIF